MKGRSTQKSPNLTKNLTGGRGLYKITLYTSYIKQKKNYVIDMSDVSAWKGIINGFRLRFGATSGSVSVSRVVITK